jgi:hypothetical protein
MAIEPHRPPENIPFDPPPPEEWPPREWREAEEREARNARDPEQGQHFVWIGLALIICVIAWWGL